MVKIKVDVTKQHIQKGVSFDCDKCPVARAIVDAGFKGVRVAIDYVTLYKSESDAKKYRAVLHPGLINVTVALPRKAQKFIDIFDSGDEVKPFSFILKLNNEQARQLNIAA